MKSEKHILVFHLETDEHDERPIYLTGNFNNWQVEDPSFEMKKIEAGKYEFELTVKQHHPDTFEYKYVKGDWDHEELNNAGKRVKNRRVHKFLQTVSDRVPQWQNTGKPHQPQFLPKIEILEDLAMPKGIKTRRIAALLPYDYDTSKKNYPVLYLQDGQNLFDEFAPFGNWALDKKLALLAEEDFGDVIIIAIDHAREDRILEYLPSEKTKLGEGLGKEYASFMTEVLKPQVDATYRTIPYREFTGIGGSSMGGLITLYAAMQFPQVYSRLMVFSPSLWVSPHLIQDFGLSKPPFCGRMYLYGGGNEGSNMEGFLNELHNHNQEVSNCIKSKLSINPEGHHSESEWGREFPEALKWLFFS